MLDKEKAITLYRRGLLSVILIGGITFLQLRELTNSRDWFHAGLVNYHISGGTIPNNMGNLYLSAQEHYEDRLFQVEGLNWYEHFAK